jgi:ArsR family transcriptional regulator
MKNLSKTVKKSILFICDDNSVRSQMAEALLRAKANDIFNVYSAGIQPETIDGRALNVLSDFSLPIKHLISKSTEEFIGKSFDYVITLCDFASQRILSSPQSYPQALKQLSWHFSDPKLNDNPYSFVTVLTQLSSRIAMFMEIEKEALHNSQQSTLSNRPNKKADQLDPIVFYKCLTDDIRLKCLMLLQYHGELCVCLSFRT